MDYMGSSIFDFGAPPTRGGGCVTVAGEQYCVDVTLPGVPSPAPPPAPTFPPPPTGGMASVNYMPIVIGLVAVAALFVALKS